MKAKKVKLDKKQYYNYKIGELLIKNSFHVLILIWAFLKEKESKLFF